MKTDFGGSFQCFTSTPKERIDHWFNIFRGLCTWEEEDDHLVRPLFEHYLQRHLKATMHEVRKRKTTPKWLNPLQFADVQKNKKDPKHIIRAKRERDNKLCSADSDGKIKPTHHFGSISTVDYIERMSSKNNGKAISAPEVFFEAHTKATSDGVRLFSKAKDKEILGRLSKQEGSPRGSRGDGTGK